MEEYIFILIKQYSDYDDSNTTLVLASLNEHLLITISEELNKLKEDKTSYYVEKVKVI